MAKLYASLDTNRNGRRNWRTKTIGEQVHRLGDDWVEAEVRDWEHAVVVYLTAEGALTIKVSCVGTPNYVTLYEGPIAEVLHPKPVAVSQPAEVTAIELDVQQFLKESA